MRTDNLFYKLFQTLPNVLFEILEEPRPQTEYTFRSLQLKELARTIDGIFVPNNKEYFINFLKRAVRPQLSFPRYGFGRTKRVGRS